MSVAMTPTIEVTRQPNNLDRMFVHFNATGDASAGGITISWSPFDSFNPQDEIHLVDFELQTTDSARDFYLAVPRAHFSALGAPLSDVSVHIIAARTDSWYNNFATGAIFQHGDGIYGTKFPTTRKGGAIYLGHKQVSSPTFSGGFSTNTNTKTYNVFLIFDIQRAR